MELVGTQVILVSNIQDIELIERSWIPAADGITAEDVTLLHYYLAILHVVFCSIELIVLAVEVGILVVVSQVFHLNPVTYLTVVTEVLPVGFTILIPDGLVVEV